MRVLLIKTSSMGDLIHTLPALTDAMQAIPGIQFDWIAEESFKEIPTWHPAVSEVVPIALRKWRKGIFSSATRTGWRNLRHQLQQKQYDVILDAQGLAKSAFLGFLANGERVGLDWQSARESIASIAYQRKCTVNFYQHAVIRMRQLFSQALKYDLQETAPSFGLDKTKFQPGNEAEPYLVLLHGTTWVSKQWPEAYWLELAKMANNAGFRVKIGGGNAEEVSRAERIAKQCDKVDLVPYLKISEMAQLLAHANGAVAVDTGFGHLAGALDIPLVSIYGSTNALYTGALGRQSINLSADFTCAPCLNRDCTFKESSIVSPACYEAITPSRVWQTLKNLGI